jgi:hypothetical protein
MHFVGRLGPLEGEMDDGAWLLDILQSLEGGVEDGRLSADVSWLAQVAAQGVFDGRHAG